MATKPPMTVDFRNRLVTTDVPADGDVYVFRSAAAPGGAWTPEPQSGGGGGDSVPVALNLSASRYVTESAWTVIGAGSFDAGEYPDRDFFFAALGWTEDGASMDVRLFDLTGSTTVDTRTISSSETTESKSTELALNSGVRTYEVRARMPAGGVGFVAAAFITAEV